MSDPLRHRPRPQRLRYLHMAMVACLPLVGLSLSQTETKAFLKHRLRNLSCGATTRMLPLTMVVFRPFGRGETAIGTEPTMTFPSLDSTSRLAPFVPPVSYQSANPSIWLFRDNSPMDTPVSAHNICLSYALLPLHKFDQPRRLPTMKSQIFKCNLLLGKIDRSMAFRGRSLTSADSISL
jgi:hypothetical protein